MVEIERNIRLADENSAQPGVSDGQQVDLDVPSFAAAWQSSPEDELDWHLGRGVRFSLGPHREVSVELYAQVVRVRLPHAQLAVPRRAAEIAPEGVVFQDPEHFFLSVGRGGDVLFQYAPPSPGSEALGSETPARQEVPQLRPPELDTAHSLAPTPSPRSPAPPEKAKSERYVGRLGEVKTHRTKQGQRVAEVELTVADPERPGASRLVKFVAFGDNADSLAQNYRPGQEVTAVGIPHDLRRKGKDGREWTERQLYLVQLPKARGNS